MWYTYILFSEKIDKYYTGYCENLDTRLEKHNSGYGQLNNYYFSCPNYPDIG